MFAYSSVIFPQYCMQHGLPCSRLKITIMLFVGSKELHVWEVVDNFTYRAKICHIF